MYVPNGAPLSGPARVCIKMRRSQATHLAKLTPRMRNEGYHNQDLCLSLMHSERGILISPCGVQRLALVRHSPKQPAPLAGQMAVVGKRRTIAGAHRCPRTSAPSEKTDSMVTTQPIKGPQVVLSCPHDKLVCRRRGGNAGTIRARSVPCERSDEAVDIGSTTRCPQMVAGTRRYCTTASPVV